jgi:hypothetical protein
VVVSGRVEIQQFGFVPRSVFVASFTGGFRASFKFVSV